MEKMVYDLEIKKKKALLIFTDIYSDMKKNNSLVSKTNGKKIEALRLIEEDELCSLTKNILIEPAYVMRFKIASPNSAFLVGSGQLEKIAETAQTYDAEIIIFNSDLSPSVQRNLEAFLHRCVIDRREVIITIFADRAKTREAVLQAQLAELEYSMPRLSRRWEGMAQQRGGVKGSRGAGEKKRELDKRKLRSDIAKLKKEVEKVKIRRGIQRKNRICGSKKVGAIVGYTNAGKSSLLKKLSGADIFTEDALFATLDAETRKIFFQTETETISFLLTDTVGFVSNLPHQLIDSFRSTLEEAVIADFLLIVCDASHPAMQECFAVTKSILNELGCSDKPVIIAINKIDKVFDRGEILSFKLQYPEAVEISVKTGIGLDEFKTKLKQIVSIN